MPLLVVKDTHGGYQIDFPLLRKVGQFSKLGILQDHQKGSYGRIVSKFNGPSEIYPNKY